MTGIFDIHSARILIIDDCCDTASSLCELLTLKGYRSVSWTTGNDVLHSSNQADSYDLLLLDMHMPVTTGLNIMEYLRQKSSQDCMQVIAMSGDQRYREVAAEAGACAFLLKPFDYSEVEVAVSNAISTPQRSIAKPVGSNPSPNGSTQCP